MESNISRDMSPNTSSKMEDDSIDDELEEQGDLDDLGTHTEGIAGPSSKVVKPLTTEELSAFKVAQEKTGVIYISRIPPGMRPTKVKHLMSAYGEVGRVYLQPEDPKRSFLRRKYTSTKKVHYTEGWIEFKDKRVARSVADMLNAQPIGGKKGTRWRDDVWTMKYLPKFKWNMLTEQIAHEAAVHAAQLRVELSQSRREQHEYLKNVELARVLDKRAERKRKAEEDGAVEEVTEKEKPGQTDTDRTHRRKKREKVDPLPALSNAGQLESVLGNLF